MNSKIQTFIVPKISLCNKKDEKIIKDFFIDKDLNDKLGIPESYKLYDNFNSECLFYTIYGEIGVDNIKDIKDLFSNNRTLFIQSNILKHVLDFNNKFIDNFVDSLIIEKFIPSINSNRTFYDEIGFIIFNILRLNGDKNWYKEYFKEENFNSYDIAIIKKNFKESLVNIITLKNNVLINLFEICEVSKFLSVEINYIILKLSSEETYNINNNFLHKYFNKSING